MSATKGTIGVFQSLTNASMATSLTSALTKIQNLDDIGIQVKWTSSNAVGTIAVECSINYNANLATGDWVALTFDPALAQPASNNGSYLIDLQQVPFTWLRVTYTRVSGSGTLNVWLSAKEI